MKHLKYLMALLFGVVLAGCQTTAPINESDQRYKFVPTSGGDVEYLDVAGSGDVGVVLLHGDVGTYADTVNIIRVSMLQVAEKLNAEFKVPVFAIARPGYGRTVGGTFGSKGTYSETSLGRVIEAIEGIAKMNNLEKVDLVGFSGGGATATMIAMQRPDLVRKLVVYGAEVDPAAMKSNRKSNPRATSASEYAIYPAKMLDGVSASSQVDYRFLFGTKDEIIPISIGKTFVDRMKAKGFNATFTAVEGTSHYDFFPKNSDVVQAEVRKQLSN